jgi:ABC-2 type transport system permease protein
LIQLNVDATRQSQAQTGTGYIQSIVNDEIRDFAQRYRAAAPQPVELVPRSLFNPNLSAAWFAAVTAVINNVTQLGILLTGAALIREREHGTIEHLLVMPVTPLEIMLSKLWSMAVVVLVASSLSLKVVVEGFLAVDVPGSVLLFGVATLLYLFAAASIGIFMGTLARNMPQFGLMSILVLLPLQILSGALTPRESMPELVRVLMSFTPTTHYVSLAQAVLFRDAGVAVVWPQFLIVAAIGGAFFALAHQRLRKTISAMQA